MSTTVVAADSNQLNFNPSWMRPVSVPVSAGGGNVSGTTMQNRAEPLFAAENSAIDYPIADPIFVKNRYGREDLLALLSKDVHPPDDLDKCLFYVSAVQKPIVLTPLSDTETRLQHNINSSKAMSLLSHADRATIASGGMIGSPSIPLQLRAGQENRSFSPSWMSAAGGGNSGFGRGNLQFGRAAFGSSYRGRGITQTSSTNPSEPVVIGRFSGSRNNRANITGFGRGNTTQPFNARAQGLYDPRDPRDRPRPRLRSTCDDTPNPSFGSTIDDSSAPLNCGWTQVGRAAAPWSKRTHAGVNAVQQSASSAEFKSQSQLPEWMSDDQERGDSSNLEETGSFDDSGQFQAAAIAQRMATTLDLVQNPTSNVSVGVAERQRSHQEEKNVLPPSVPVTVPSTWSILPNNLEHPQSNRIAKQFVESANSAINLPEQSLSVTATAASVNSPFQQNYTDDVTLLGQPVSMGLTSRTDHVDEWYYVDPKNAVQGPFPTIHMQAWYKLGYFTSELRVRHGQNSDSTFTTLGELIALNGEETPFKLKPYQSPVMQLPLQQTRDVGRNIWSRDYSVSLIEAAKVKKERQKLEEEQRRMAEQERQLKEMREALLKEEEERLARERRIMEKELQLQRAQEELAQLAAEEKERSAAREREIEAEKKRLAEEMERTKKEEVERAIAETRRMEEEKERQRLKEEAEMYKKKADELKRIQEKTEETARKAAAEQKRQQQQSNFTTATAREKENLHHKPPIKSNKGNASREFVIAEEPPLRQKKSENTSANWRCSWQAASQSGEEKVATPKTAPWVTVTNKRTADRSEPSLLDIQQEEERQMIEEMKHKQQQQINGVAMWKDASEAARTGVWSSAAQKLKWGQNSQPTPDAVVMTSRQVAWGGAKGMNEITATKAIWDDPSLSEGGKIKTSKNLQNANKSERANTEHEAVKKILKQSVRSSVNALTSWMINKVRQLNPQVDADVFAAFIEGVDNPNEVEDYIIGYLGENRSVKELIREFLERRSQLRQKREPVDKDDLTHPAQAADTLSTTAANSKSDSSTSQQILTGGGKRKKKGNKGNKLIVDGACLGFKGAVDPNRVNVGEIDTVSSGTIGHSHK